MTSWAVFGGGAVDPARWDGAGSAGPKRPSAMLLSMLLGRCPAPASCADWEIIASGRGTGVFSLREMGGAWPFSFGSRATDRGTSGAISDPRPRTGSRCAGTSCSGTGGIACLVVRLLAICPAAGASECATGSDMGRLDGKGASPDVKRPLNAGAGVSGNKTEGVIGSVGTTTCSCRDGAGSGVSPGGSGASVWKAICEPASSRPDESPDKS